MMNRLGWALTGALAVIAILALARATVAGPLDPPGPVGSTMRTLDELVPSWGKSLSSSGGCDSQRFECVMTADAAVLDRETGLVWMRTPDSDFKTYDAATGYCHFTPTGGRYGWRLPTLTELWSLADDSADDNLPDGSPFINAGGGVYWSSSLWEDDQYVVTLAFFGGFLEELVKAREGTEFSNTWCVRGGQALDDDPRYAEQPAWSRTLSSEGGCGSQRFECVMNGAAVLDRETGLVWELAPAFQDVTWVDAMARCNLLAVGSRTGWRLATLAELGTLVDQTKNFPDVAMPTGHPFQGIGGGFWTITEDRGIAGNVLGWLFSSDGPGPAAGLISYGKVNAFNSRAWCVRGPDPGPP